MANRFAVDGNRLTIDQTRRGARLLLGIALFGLVFGATTASRSRGRLRRT